MPHHPKKVCLAQRRFLTMKLVPGRKCTAPVSLRNLILVLQSVLDIASALIRISISSFSGISKEVVNGGAAAATAVGKHYQSQCE